MSTDARGAREYVADDGFHEIQLSGKQLVFLFMATTVVSIVIFLCGVLVGRGGRPEPSAFEAIGTPVSDAGAPVGATPDATSGGEVTIPSADPGVEAPASATADEQSYINYLTDESQQATIETPPADADAPPTGGAGSVPPTAVVAKPTAQPASPPAAAPVAPAAVPAAAPATPGGWTIQVSAFRDRGQADQFAAQLKAKRYEAYVAAPDASSPLFRVRVGSFNERRDATRVADRLKKDKFKPWVTR